jgi:hypothetical protein
MSGERKSANFLEQLEACRPGSDDLRDEALAPAAERIAADSTARRYFEHVQRTDARLNIAFHDVPVPAGLAERLLAAVESASPAVAVGQREPQSGDRELRPATSSRRRALQLAIAASLFAVIGGGLTLLSQLAPYSNQQCLSAAAQAGAQLKPDRWQNIRTTPAPADRQPRTRLSGAIKSWQPASLLGDNQAVAYRFTNGAMLLVCRPGKSVAGLPLAPPAVPQQKAQQSSGMHVGMWSSDGLVHVLMISGPVEEYRRMTGTVRPVVAQVRPQGLPDRYDG